MAEKNLQLIGHVEALEGDVTTTNFRDWINAVNQQNGLEIITSDQGGLAVWGDLNTLERARMAVVEMESELRGRLNLVLGEANSEIYENGKPIVLIDGDASGVEKLLLRVKELTGQQGLDFHLSGGVAQVLFLGDDLGRDESIRMIESLLSVPNPDGISLRKILKEGESLHRDGIDSWQNLLAVDNNSLR